MADAGRRDACDASSDHDADSDPADPDGELRSPVVWLAAAWLVLSLGSVVYDYLPSKTVHPSELKRPDGHPPVPSSATTLCSSALAAATSTSGTPSGWYLGLLTTALLGAGIVRYRHLLTSGRARTPTACKPGPELDAWLAAHTKRPTVPPPAGWRRPVRPETGVD